MAKAGGNADALPTNWDGVFELARKIKALGGQTQGFHFDWDITGNWMWQALVFSNGGTMLTADEKKVAFDGAAGKTGIETLNRMVTEGTMRDVAQNVSLQDFTSGTMGIWGHSTSRLGGVTKQVADKFKLRTGPFPCQPDGRLPLGGNVAMMFTKDAAKQKAAWEYIKFATGPIGATMMVNATGYFPSAFLKFSTATVYPSAFMSTGIVSSFVVGNRFTFFWPSRNSSGGRRSSYPLTPKCIGIA